MGILPSYEKAARKALEVRGVSPECVIVLYGEGDGDWDQVRCLSDWLRQNPDAHLLVLCNRFKSRQDKYLFDTLLDKRESGRVHVQAVPHRWYDETNWWQRRAGWSALFNAYVGFVYVRLCGEDSEESDVWDPDEYEKALMPNP